MKIDAAFPSKYIKAADLHDRPHVLVMARVELEDIGDAERKPVLYFTKAKKGLVLNITNAKTIKAAYGGDTDNWEGKPIELFPAMVEFKGDTVEAVRVRLPKAGKPVAVPAPAANDMPGFGDFDDSVEDVADTF